MLLVIFKYVEDTHPIYKLMNCFIFNLIQEFVLLLAALLTNRNLTQS